MRFSCVLSGLLTWAILPLTVLGSLQIVPGASWTTVNAPYQHVQAHGGGVLLVGGLYYLIGENKLDGSAFQSINCYSSPDLVNWSFVRKLLTVGQGPSDLAAGRVVERPHIIYNEQTKKYVMWMHIDSSSYGDAKTGVATSDSICGAPYTYIGSTQPLGFQSRDMNLFKDTDGSAYLLTEDRVNGLRIDSLTSDYLKPVKTVFLWPEKYTYEAAAILKKGNTYFMFASHQSGWDPNDNIYTTATNLAGPWAAWKLLAPEGTKTYKSQTASVVDIGGVPVYMGDRWVSSNLMRSTYVWLPITLSGTTATLNNEVNWVLNSGSWSPGPVETTYEAEASANVLASGSKSVACSACSGKTAIGYIGGPSNGKLTISNVSSTVTTSTTIRINYSNADSTQRYATMSVNGAKYIVAFIPTGDDNTPGTASVTVKLNAGAVNTFVFEAYNSGWGPNIDRIAIPVS